MTRVRTGVARTFAALHNRNYRLYFFGQAVSISGTWMQSVAQAWLVLELTDSGVALGLVLATQFLPILLAGPWGGLVADRFDKRRLLLVTQTCAGLLALTLGLLTLTGLVQLWMVFVLAGLLGCVNALDNPSRQTFVLEMVGPDSLANAVSLNSVVVNAARVVGPALAGALIATVGTALCFLINAGSFVAVVAALAAMRTTDLIRAAPAPRRPRQLREGFAYVRATPSLRVPLIIMAVIGTLAYEFQVTLPLLARTTFHADADAYGAMTAAMGAGAVVGGLLTAGQGRPTSRRLTLAGAAFGAVMLLLAAAPSLTTALLVLPLVGAVSINFIALSNSTLQLGAEPQMRGRVMALYAVAFLGSTPIGGPIVGAVGQMLSPRAALALGGLAAAGAALYGRIALPRIETPALEDEEALAVIPDTAAITDAEASGPTARYTGDPGSQARLDWPGHDDTADADRAGADRAGADRAGEGRAHEEPATHHR